MDGNKHIIYKIQLTQTTLYKKCSRLVLNFCFLYILIDNTMDVIMLQYILLNILISIC